MGRFLLSLSWLCGSVIQSKNASMPSVFQKDRLDLLFDDDSTPLGAGVAECREGWEVDAAALTGFCTGCGASAIGTVARVAGAVFGMAD